MNIFLCIYSFKNMSNYFKVVCISELDIPLIKTINNIDIRFLQKVDDFSLEIKIYEKFYNYIVYLNHYGHVSSWLYCPFEYIIFEVNNFLSNNIHNNKSNLNNNIHYDRKTSSNFINKKYKLYDHKTFSPISRKSTFFEVCGISS